MKKAIFSFIIAMVAVFAPTAQADSWADFQASMTSFSVSSKSGYSMSSGAFNAFGGVNDSKDFGGYSARGNLSSQVLGNGAANSNIGTMANVNANPFVTSVSAFSGASTQTFAGTGGMAEGNANMATNVWSVNLGALPPLSPPAIVSPPVQ